MNCVVRACALLLVGVVLSSAATAQNSPALRDALEVIRNQLAKQGQLSYSIVVHDSSDNRTWTNRFTVEASKVVVDEKGCRIGFHWHTTVDGKVVADVDSGLPLSVATGVALISMSEDMARSAVKAGHDSWGMSVQPQIWVVHLVRDDGSENAVDFRDKASTQVALDAMKKAIELCP